MRPWRKSEIVSELLFPRADAAQHRSPDQDADAQGDADGEQRAVFGLRAHARQGVPAVTGAALERIAAVGGAEF